MIKAILYTTIRPAEGQAETDIHRKAQAMGYTLIPFEGFSDADLGAPGNRGPRWKMASENRIRINDLTDACHHEGDWPEIRQTR
jgi:hypothetical protein